MSSRFWTEKVPSKYLGFLGYFLLLVGMALGLSVFVEQIQPLLERFFAPPAQVEESGVLPGVRLLGDGFQPPRAEDTLNAQEETLFLRTYLQERESRFSSSGPTTIPSRIQIPALSLDDQVVSVPFQDGTWDLWPIGFKIGYLEGTGRLGQGNMVLAGHISIHGQEGPFRYLATLQPGDTVTLYYQDQVFTYRVRDSKAVDPREVSVLAPTESPALTLLTCETWSEERGYYVQRRVVIAELVSTETITQ